MSENIPKIHAAICGVMTDVGAVAKNDMNQYDKYKFRGIDAVMNALHPAMVKNRVFVTPEVLDMTREERSSKAGGANMIYTTVKVKYTFYTDDGSSVTAVVFGEAMDRSDKSTNKAMSAAYKYACFQTFCIPTEEMQDSEKDSLEPAPKEPAEGLVARVAKLKIELERTGLSPQNLLATFKIKYEDEESLEQNLAKLTEFQYTAAMKKFEKTPDKA